MSSIKTTYGISLIIIAVVLGLASAIIGGWDIIEPLMSFVTLGVAASTYIQTRKAKKAVYADNGDGEWVVVLQVGRSVVQAVNTQFGQIDALIDVVDTIGTNTLSTPAHYNALAKATYKAIEQGQNKNIKLIVSGPLGLNVMIGQLIGLHHFNIEVFQFDMATGGYIAVPKVTRDLL